MASTSFCTTPPASSRSKSISCESMARTCPSAASPSSNSPSSSSKHSAVAIQPSRFCTSSSHFIAVQPCSTAVVESSFLASGTSLCSPPTSSSTVSPSSTHSSNATAPPVSTLKSELPFPGLLLLTLVSATGVTPPDEALPMAEGGALGSDGTLSDFASVAVADRGMPCGFLPSLARADLSPALPVLLRAVLSPLRAALSPFTTAPPVGRSFAADEGARADLSPRAV
mmetsp:Transcript_13645/g.35104  ORF Transcript_13645/g.35104 Transcript_13645/m.35104 type:complete len:227 (-) Transcript_13645:92-772(-)